jgi:hypothetical protein
MIKQLKDDINVLDDVIKITSDAIKSNESLLNK